jgi:hypothetical protein
MMEAVTIVNPDSSSGWSQVRNSAGMVGWVPANILFADCSQQQPAPAPAQGAPPSQMDPIKNKELSVKNRNDWKNHQAAGEAHKTEIAQSLKLPVAVGVHFPAEVQVEVARLLKEKGEECLGEWLADFVLAPLAKQMQIFAQ